VTSLDELHLNTNAGKLDL